MNRPALKTRVSEFTSMAEDLRITLCEAPLPGWQTV